MSPPDISVVIATFDRPDRLVSCLDSLRGQKTTRTFEVIVVDNHPQSGVALATRLKYSEVRWLEEPIAGLSRARNRGIIAASGAVVVTTDDDVIARPEWLERLTTPLFSQTALSATTGNCLPRKVETEAETLFEAYGGLRHGDDTAEYDALWLARRRIFFPQIWRIGTTANAAFRASLFEEGGVGFFDLRLGAGSPAGAWEDLDFFYRMLRAGCKIRYLPDACVHHAHREDMPGLTRQLCSYRRGETAFLTLALLRDHDLRALGQALIWIPRWRIVLLLKELALRIGGRRRFPLLLFRDEALAYFAGPLALLRGA